MKIFSVLDMLKNALRNAVVDPLGAAPSGPVPGQIYFDTILNRLRVYQNSEWGLTAEDALKLNGQNAAFYLDRANHTGTLSATTISNLASTVQGYSLSTFAAPTAALPMGGQRITNVGTPTNATDAATMGWVTSQIQSAAAGIDSKPSVRVLANTNITLSGTQTIDDVAVTAGNRVLVRGQTDAKQNGVYVVATGAWSRATDADETGELTPGAFWFVEEGTTYGRTQWRIENTGTITIGTSNISINQFGAVAGGYTAGMGVDITGTQVSVSLASQSGLTFNGNNLAVDTSKVARKFTFTLGDGTATTFTVTHNLGTKDVTVGLRLASTDEWVMADWVATDSNTLTVTFAVAPTANAIKGVVIG